MKTPTLTEGGDSLMNIPTPRTDANAAGARGWYSCPTELVTADFARTLEREAAHHSAQLEKYRAVLGEAQATIEGLAGQQAMPDDFYKSILVKISALLHPDSTK